MKSKVVLWSWVMVLVSSLAVSAGTVSVIASRDNTLIENATGSLSNGEGDIFVGRTGQPAGQSIRRGLVYFDIANSLPSGVTITSATLTMRDIMGNNGDRVANLHRVLTNWGEGLSFQGGGMGAPAQQNDATWLYTFYNASNPTASPKWTTVGGDFDPTVSGSTVIFGNTMGQQANFQWSSAGMVSDIQTWLDTPASNFGWLIQGVQSTGMTAKRLRGRTNNTVVVSNRPELVITYVPEPATFGLAMVSMSGLLLVVRSRRRVG